MKADVVSTAAKVVGFIVLCSGALWAGMNELRALDQKYVPLSEWQDFQWSQIKRDIRAIEKEIAEAEFRGMDDYAEKLEEELDSLIEFLCRKYPEDREC